MTRIRPAWIRALCALLFVVPSTLTWGPPSLFASVVGLPALTLALLRGEPAAWRDAVVVPLGMAGLAGLAGLWLWIIAGDPATTARARSLVALLCAGVAALGPYAVGSFSDTYTGPAWRAVACVAFALVLIMRLLPRCLVRAGAS